MMLFAIRLQLVIIPYEEEDKEKNGGKGAKKNVKQIAPTW
jgi:hypothetical protein